MVVDDNSATIRKCCFINHNAKTKKINHNGFRCFCCVFVTEVGFFFIFIVGSNLVMRKVVEVFILMFLSIS